MSSWNLRPVLTKEQKAKEERIEAYRKAIFDSLSKNGVDHLVKKGIDCREMFRKNTENEVAIRRKNCEKNAAGWTYS